MNDYLDALALEASKDAASKKKHGQYKQILLDIEEQFIAHEKALDRDTAEICLGQIASLAEKIWDVKFRDENLKDLCKKYLGAKSLYAEQIKPLMTKAVSEEEVISPIRYDSKKMRITYYTGNNHKIIAEDFLLNILYKLKDEYKDTRWILEMKKRHDSEVIEVSNDEFSSAKKMKTLLLAESLSLVISDDQLSQLHSFLLKGPIKSGKKIIRLGYDADVDGYIFANGCWKDGQLYTANDTGIVEINETVISMPIFNKEDSDAHWFRYEKPKPDDLNLQQLYYYLCQAYTPDVASHVIHHYFVSIFRDIIMDSVKFAPLLLLKGMPGSGKTALSRLIAALFGNQKPSGNINLKSANTKVGITRELSAFSNYAMVMEELDPSNTDYKSIAELLQSLYDNGSAVKAQRSAGGGYATGLQTESTPPKCTAFITSNFFPDNEIFFSRFIYVSLSNQVKNQEQFNAYHGFLKKYEARGMSYITASLQQHRGYIRNNFTKAYMAAVKGIQARLADNTIMDRLILNQAVLCALSILINEKEDIFAGAVTPADYKDAMYNGAARQITIQHNEMSENGVLRDFFTLLQKAFDTRRFIHLVHFKRSTKGAPTVVLRLKYVYESIYKLDYQMLYRAKAPERRQIEAELSKLLGLREDENLYGQISGSRFFPPDLFKNSKGELEVDMGEGVNRKMITYKECVVIPYQLLADKFSMDWDFWGVPEEK